MFTSIEHFTTVYKAEVERTEKLLGNLTDASLSKPDHKDLRSLGRAAWHIVTTYPEMCRRFDIHLNKPSEKDPIPKKAADIKDAYHLVTRAVLQAVGGWKDADLRKEDDMYGEKWPRGKSLWVLVVHEIHHRAQMTVLMRLAGVPVTGVYGPSREEWSQYGTKAPEV